MSRSDKEKESSGNSKATRLPMFFNDKPNVDINGITIDDFLNFFYSKNFDEFFDREKILAYLEEKARVFEKEIFVKMSCPHCGSREVKKLDAHSQKEYKEYYNCLRCKRKFPVQSFIGSWFPDWVIATTLSNVFQGKKPKEIFESLKTEATNRYKDYGGSERIPDEKTIYDIIGKCAEKFKKFNDAMILLIGGIKCRTLLADDIFSPRWKKKKHTESIRPRKRRQRRFYYGIATLDVDSRFIVVLYIARLRDKLAFRIAFSETEQKLANLPQKIMGDKLASMEKAAEAFFPKNKVAHEFVKAKPWKKGKRSMIERRNRDIRKTLRKHQKYRSKKVLGNYAVIAQTGQNYLRAMEKALGGKSPAQAVGIPYPFSPKDWRRFMSWIDWVCSHMPEILKAGLKKFPVCGLAPCTESSIRLLEKRMKKVPKYIQ